MILKGSQRGGGKQLASHLLNDKDNDHVTVFELRGFVADDLHGALAEAQAVSKGTRCTQYLFSLSLNPPKDAKVGIETLIDAADRAEEALGLKDQPRAIIIHEKEGRRHAHVVWSRINPEEMKAINLPHYKYRLKDLSKELYLEHGWELPEGHKTNGWKNPLAFSLAEYQQAKRLELDPREIKQVFQSAWERSDNLASFRNALEEHGYFLAKGDRRGVVALDLNGEVFAAARWAGVKTKDANQKLGKGEGLPGVDALRTDLQKRMSKQLRGFIAQDRQDKRDEMKPLADELKTMVAGHRAERARLHERQEERRVKETKDRAARFRKGFGVVMDILSGRLFTLRRQNEREAFQGHLRDRAQRERLFTEQTRERKPLAERIDALRTRHRQERMRLARKVVETLRHTKDAAKDRERGPERAARTPEPGPEFGPELTMER